MQRHLEPEELRQQFYKTLTAYANSLKVALSTMHFYRDTPKNQLNRYQADLGFFHNLRVAVRQRYAEAIDYQEYEQSVRKLMNQHVTSQPVRPITELVNIFDSQAFASEVEQIEGTAAKADTIAYRAKKAVTARVAENPQLYQRFSQLITETIEAYRAGRLSEAEYFKRAQELLAQVQQGRDNNMPARLDQYQHAQAYFGVLQSVLEIYSTNLSDLISDDALADVAIEIEATIEKRKIRDWTTNTDIKNAMKNDIEDYLYAIKDRYKLPIDDEAMDVILEQVLEVARQRDQA